MTDKVINVDVLIAGGGPVGLTTAVELAHFGIGSMLVERNPSTTRHPKMDLTNGRALELFRRTGLAEKIRAVGVPRNSNHDVTWLSNMTSNGQILHKFGYDNADHEYWRRRTINDGTLTLEEPLRVSQIVIEPVMRETAEETNMCDLRFGWAFTDFEQDNEGVTSRITNTENGEVVTVKSKYLIACDGGNSTIRSQLGIENDGQTEVVRAYLVHFRSTDLEVLQRFGQAWHYQTGTCTMIAQNDVDEWTVHRFFAPGENNELQDPRAFVEEALGGKFEFEVLIANPWAANFLVAKEYYRGRVYMAGDACHQFMPTGGYGMNTGIAEVGNLTWKVAASLRGFGGSALMPSYHTERRPIAVISWKTSERHLGIRQKIAELYAEYSGIHGDSPEAQAQRDRLGRLIADLGNGENEGWGTEHGYSYSGSEVIIPDGTPEDPFDPMVYTPSTRPGARLPHVFLENGRAVYDLLGKWFAVVATNGSDCSAFATAAEKLGMPLEIVSLADKNASAVYGDRVLLVRPDHHVAWRGNTAPADAEAILRQALGFVD